MDLSGLDIFSILGWLIVGLVVGSVARFLVPGRDPMGCLGTALLGIIGSFVGGTLSNWYFNETLELRPSGILGSLLGAIVLVLLLRLVRGRERS
jgi:uncharacterized membrane protein YeaQ/YmgE (transglycosylase-associated protein family)